MSGVRQARSAGLGSSRSPPLAAGAPAASSPDYRCCFRLDALMTGRLDTVFDDLPGKPSDDEQATWTFMTSELVVYDVTRGGQRVRRASARRGGPWPQTDGPGVAFGVGRVTTHTAGRVACDSEYSSRVYTVAPNDAVLPGAERTLPPGRGGPRRLRHRRESRPRVRRDAARRQDRPARWAQRRWADLAPARPTLANDARDARDADAAAHPEVRQGRRPQPDHEHADPTRDDGPRARGALSHNVRRTRVTSEAAKIRALAGKEPRRVGTLPCR